MLYNNVIETVGPILQKHDQERQAERERHASEVQRLRDELRAAREQLEESNRLIALLKSGTDQRLAAGASAGLALLALLASDYEFAADNVDSFLRSQGWSRHALGWAAPGSGAGSAIATRPALESACRLALRPIIGVCRMAMKDVQAQPEPELVAGGAR